jgi:enoyl-CoA hydratase
MGEADVIIEEMGRCGVITLNRPAALNALSLAMIRGIAGALDRWESDPAVTAILIRGAGERAFCAGADIRALYHLGKAGRSEEQLAFLGEEYRLNQRIKRYPKPFVALLDGIVMGGGVGVSIHGSHRVAGDALAFAMPEVGIGFFPDVGATYFLPRLQGCVGAYLGVTGARIGCGDAVALDLASAYVPSNRHGAVVDRLADGEDPGAAIDAESARPPRPALLEHRALIDHCFSAPTVAAIAERIAADNADFARRTLEAISNKSPTSLAIALRQMQIGAALEIEEALRVEFRIAARIAKAHDFYEGVRATIIDKDHRPQWRPAQIEAVGAAAIDSYFAPLPDDLTFQKPTLPE